MKWSKLQKALYNIVDPNVNFQIKCSVFKTSTSWYGYGRPYVPRFWVTIEKDIVWDFPTMFMECESQLPGGRWSTIAKSYGFPKNYTWVAETIRAYINTPREQLLTVNFENDKYGFTDILRAVDRRIALEKRKPYIEKMSIEIA
jgi:hypothetical protein